MLYTARFSASKSLVKQLNMMGTKKRSFMIVKKSKEVQRFSIKSYKKFHGRTGRIIKLKLCFTFLCPARTGFLLPGTKPSGLPMR